MLFPKDKMQVTSSYQGKTSEEGWLVLDFSRVDTDGLGKVYVDMRDVRKLEKQKDEQASIFDRTKGLLSLDDE